MCSLASGALINPYVALSPLYKDAFRALLKYHFQLLSSALRVIRESSIGFHLACYSRNSLYAMASTDQPPPVPGLTVPIDHELPRENRFLHGVNEWAQCPRLTAKEISMLKLMDALTDKPNWNEKIFNSDIVARWREEALALPLISELAWDWCLLELQDKAKYSERNGFVLTFDTGSRCAKSDSLIDEALRAELCKSVEPLLTREEKDWHPNSDNQVNTLDIHMPPVTIC